MTLLTELKKTSPALPAGLVQAANEGRGSAITRAASESDRTPGFIQ